MAFVWDVYSTAREYTETQTATIRTFTLPDGSYSGTGYTFNKASGNFILTGYSQYYTGGSIDRQNSYVTTDAAFTPNQVGKSTSNGGMFKGRLQVDEYGVYFITDTKHSSTTTTTKGTISATATSDNASAYPQDAVSGSNWYTFRGAPSGISYPTNIEAGQAVQITWTAGTNPLYYRVERSTDGGASWQVLSATVTGTSFTDTTIAGDTSSPSVMYRVCTLGEKAVSDYSTGSEVNIPRCSVRIKINGAWVKGKATYRKENGAWVVIPMADEAAIFGADTHRKVILLTS